MILLEKEESWKSIKHNLSDTNFMANLMEFDKDNVKMHTLMKLEKYIKMHNFKP